MPSLKFYSQGNYVMNNQPSQLEKLKAQQEKIAARIQLLESRHKNLARKQDTQRKILVGSYYLDRAIKENKMEELKKRMDTYLKRNSDRKLFDLPPLQEMVSSEIATEVTA